MDFCITLSHSDFEDLKALLKDISENEKYKTTIAEHLLSQIELTPFSKTHHEDEGDK